MELWVRKCASFVEERVADREFWRQMTPDERVDALPLDGIEAPPSTRFAFICRCGEPYKLPEMRTR